VKGPVDGVVVPIDDGARTVVVVVPVDGARTVVVVVVFPVDDERRIKTH
jgi:hypothetical protein